MTTTITTVYNAIHTTLSALFPSKKELIDTILIESNDELSLADGYGIHFGPARNTNREMSRYALKREVMVTLTKANRGMHTDITVYETTDKALLEELHSLIQQFENNNTIGTPGVAIKREYVSDSGLERVITADRNFTQIQVFFEIEYLETLS